MTRLIVLCSVCLLLTESAISLTCRSGVQQVNDQFQKIVQVCKKRSTGDNDDSDSTSREDSNDSNDSSNMDMFSTKFFTSDSNSNSNKFSNTQSWKNENNNRNRGDQQRNGNSQRYSFNYTDGQWKNMQYNPNHGGNIRDFDGSVRSNYDQMYNSNSQNYDKDQQRSCIVQCVFNELNMVDQRGFPEQDSVVQFMTRNIRNPELQDFIEEIVVECFRYLSLEMRQDKCYFSQNLLSCLSDKGKERCEDWYN